MSPDRDTARIFGTFLKNCLLCGIAALLAVSPALAAEDPVAGAGSLPAVPGDLKLVVLVVVDQLRGDSILRFGPALGKDGLLRLASGGVWYRNAHYTHAHTVTGVGHATIGTGARPGAHGIASNEWYDRKTGAKITCVADAASPVVGSAGETGNASPLNLTATTFADEWILATSGRARAIGVSGKDRGAILPIGHTGKAYWFSGSSGRIVSSKFFLKELPAWAVEFNKKAPADQHFKKSWERSTRDDDGAPAAADDRSFEGDVNGMGRTFPHPLGKGMEKPESRFYTQIYTSIYGDQIVMDFALEALRTEKLGRGESVDILSISLSANDAVGHNYGPDSVEAKEILYGVDRQVAKLLQALDAEVGPGRYLVALAADHGVSFAPEVVSARGFPAGKHDTADALKRINRRLNFTIRYLDWSLGFSGPGYFFDPDALRYGGKSAAELEETVAEVIRETTGIAEVFTRSAILAGRLPDTEVGRKVRATFHPTRSPDVYVVSNIYWIGGGAGSHGEPYAYDTHIPIIFYGAGLAPREVFRQVDAMDIAPTLTAVLGCAPPSAASGQPLEEVASAARRTPKPQVKKTF